MESQRKHISDRIDDFQFDTPFEKNKSLYQLSNGKKIALVFLRYYGCTICQLDIRKFIDSAKKFDEKNTALFIVLQSEPETIGYQTSKEDIPFTIICDPKRKLYDAFAIRPAKSKLGLISLKTIQKMSQSKKMGFIHGAYEGDELQLPAVFLAGRDKIITFAHYGKSAGDIPEIDTLLMQL